MALPEDGRRALALLVMIATVACGGDEPDGAEGFIPGRDLSLAELAGGSAQGTPELVRRRPPTVAHAAIRAAVEAGTLEPWTADRYLLSLMLGRDDEVPAEFLPPGAITLVPDALPAAVIARLPGYPEAERAALERLLDAGRGAMEAVADGRARRWNPFAAGIAHAAPTPVEISGDGLVLVEAGAGQEGWAPAAAQIATEVWPRIADMMSVHLLRNEVGAEVRFRQPVSVEAQEWLDANGLPADATGTVTFERDNGRLLVHFEEGVDTDWFPVDLEVVRAADPPIRVTLIGSSTEMPTDAASSVSGRFYSCDEIYVVTGDANHSCTVAGRLTHELFHCAQRLRAGVSDKPSWVKEGTAVWAQDRFDPGSDTEWSFHSYYAYTMTEIPLGELAYMSSVFWTWSDQFNGGDGAILSLFDGLQESSPPDLVPGLVGNWPERWHRYVASTTGYEALFEEGADELTDQGGPFPYMPSDGCPDDAQPWKVGQEFWRDPQELSTSRFPVYDFELRGPSAQHELVQVQAVETMQYIDVAMFGQLGDLAASGIPDVRLEAVLYGEDGSETIEDWTVRWQTPGAEPLAVTVPDPEHGMELESDTSFRICMTEDAPCQDADTVYPTLTEIRFYLSWADPSPQPLLGQLVLLPGGIQGWTAKAYRLGPPEHDEQED